MAARCVVLCGVWKLTMCRLEDQRVAGAVPGWPRGRVQCSAVQYSTGDRRAVWYWAWIWWRRGVQVQAGGTLARPGAGERQSRYFRYYQVSLGIHSLVWDSLRTQTVVDDERKRKYDQRSSMMIFSSLPLRHKRERERERDNLGRRSRRSCG